MQTIEVNELVSATFEACVEFGAQGDGAPVCAGCGWLEADHDLVDPEVRNAKVRNAEIHALTPRAPARRTEKRLAS